jgi:hemoglobin/transferrin/lactoferrin receptor protein
MSYSETRGKDAGRALTSVPPDKLVAMLGLRVPELSLVFTGRGRLVKRRDQVPAGVPVTPGYGVCDLYASWLPAGASYSSLRVDFGIENADKSYRRPLSLIDEGGEISSSRFPTGFNGEVIPDVRIVRVSFGIDQRS